MADQHPHDLIEKYLLGELSREESARLEADMAADPDLFGQVEIQRLGLMGLRRLATAHNREKFARWDEDLDALSPPQAMPPPGRNIWIWTIITLLLLLTAGAFWHFRQASNTRKIQEQERQQLRQRDSLIAVLQAEYLQKAEELATLQRNPGPDSLAFRVIKNLREEISRKDQALRVLEGGRSGRNPQIAMRLAPPSNTVRGSDESADPTLAAAQKAFETSDFKEAVRLWKSIPKNDPRQTEVREKLPYGLFYAQRYREAIPAFLQLWEEQPEYEYMEAQGYLLLCYIAEGMTLEARQMRLVILHNPNHKYYKMADGLGDSIK